MAIQASRLNDDKYLHWLRSSLSLLYLKEGITSYCDEKGREFHNAIKDRVRLKSLFAVFKQCTKCTSENAKRAKTKDKKNTWRMDCRCNVCNIWLEETLPYHKNYPCPNIAWSNSDPKSWPSDAWELCKLFLPFGSEGQRGPADSDCQALLILMMDCRYFHTFLPNTQLLHDINQERNACMHSKDMKVEDAEMRRTLGLMISLLEQPCLALRPSCVEAKTKIIQLRDNILDISLNKELELQALNNKIEAVRSDVDRLEAELHQLQTSLGDVATSQDTTAEEYRQMCERVKELGQTIAKMKTNQEQHSQTIDTRLGNLDAQTASKMADLTSRLQELEKNSNKEIERLEGSFQSTIARIETTLGDLAQRRMTDLEVTSQQQASTITTLYQRQQATDTELQNQQQESQAHASQLEHHQNELDAHASKLDQLEEYQGELDTHTIMLKDHETQLQGHQSHIESQNRTLDSHETQLLGHQSQIESQNRTLDSHETQLQGHQSHIESQKRTLDSHETQLQGHQSHIESQKRTLDSHETQLQGHQRHIESQHRTLDSHETQLQGHQSHIESQNRTLGSHETQLQGHQRHIESQNRTLDRHETQLQYHQSHKETQNRTLDSHETQLQGHQGHIESQHRTLERYGATLDRLENKQIAQQTDQAVDIQDLQCQLISMYSAWIQHFPVYLLMSEKKICLEDIYVEQRLKVVDHDGKMKTESTISKSRQATYTFQEELSMSDSEYVGSSESDSEDENQSNSAQFISSLRDLFYSESNKCQHVYVSGNAGYGKSIFCSHLVRLWCKAHSGNITALTRDEDLIAEFPLLFCVDLRDAKYDGNVHTPDEMCSLIQKQLQRSGIVLPYDCLSKLLQAKGQVLVVMDALDECREERLPIGGRCNNCTTLVTSRPWKFEALRQDPECRVDKELEIVGLKKGSPEDLSENLVKLLNKKWEESKNSKDFIRTMEEEGLQEFLDVPVLLTSMLCLWFDDIPFGQSQVEVYRNSIHHQILTAIKAKNIPKYSCPGEVQFPTCQREKCQCQAFGELLWKVSELACIALLGNVRERALVMDHGQTEFLGLTDEEVAICMKLGILTQYKLLGNITDYEKHKSVSFAHKTYQEWFAAVYLSSKLPVSELDKVLSKAINDLDSALELNQMFLFVCGINAKVAAKLTEFIMSNVSSDKRVQDYRRSGGFSHDKLISTIQDVIVAGANEAKKSNTMSTALQLHDVHIGWYSGTFSTEQILVCDTSHARSVNVGNVRIEKRKITPRPESSCLEKLKLWNTNALDDIFCNNFSAEQLVILHLEYVTSTHDQLESLCGSLTKTKTGSLRTVFMSQLTCITHRNSRQDCSIMFDLSQHQGLKELTLQNLSMIEVAGLSIMLEEVDLRHITLTHDGLESLFGSLASAKSPTKVDIEELTCKTHKDNRQECYIQLDYSQYVRLQSLSLENNQLSKWQLPNVQLTSWPSSSCMQTLALRRVDLSPCDTFCDNFIIDTVSIMSLEDVKLTHEQLESLCGSLATAGSLTRVDIEELFCKTHKDSRQNCYIYLDFSQCVRLQSLNFIIDMVSNRYLEDVILTHAQLESLLWSLASAESIGIVNIEKLTCKTHKHNRQECYIQLGYYQYVRLHSLNLENSNPCKWQLPYVNITSWPSSSCMETLDLRRVDLSPCDTFCDNFIIDMVSNLYLEEVLLTHDQLGSLCARMASAMCLRIVNIETLTCKTHKHKHNIHECIMFDLSQHQGLKELTLQNLSMIEVAGVSIMLEEVDLRHITLTHDVLESLFGSLASAKSPTKVDIEELTCKTHKDNRHECYIQLDYSQYVRLQSLSLENNQQSKWQLPNVQLTSWPSSSCMETLDLRRVDLSPCDNFIIDMVSKMYLENVRLAHKQLESLCGSLASAGNLRTVHIRELTCITHRDNLQDCSIMLDLSQHQRLENLRLWDLCVGEVRGINLYQNMDKLKKVELDNIRLTHDGLGSLCASLATSGSLSIVVIEKLTCITHKDNRQDCCIQLDFSQNIGMTSLSFEKINQFIWQLPNIKITSWPSSSCMQTLDLRRVDLSPCDTFCDNFIIDMVSNMYLVDVKLTHDQLESLCACLTQAVSLRTVVIRHLTCITHKDNRQDCCIQQDFSHNIGTKSLSFDKIHQSGWQLPNVQLRLWPSSSCMGTLDLRRVDLSPCDTFCDNFIIDMVSKMYLENVRLTHKQLESLCGSMVSAENLRIVNIEKLFCKTHQDNKQDCYIQLNYSQYVRLQSLSLANQHQSGWHLPNVKITSWPSSSCMGTLDLRRVDLSPCDTFCDNFIIDMVSKMYLENVRLTHKQLESLCGSMVSAGNLRIVNIEKLFCITHQNNKQDCYIQLNYSQYVRLQSLSLANQHQSGWHLPNVKITSWPSSSCMETLDLRRVDLLPCDTFCDNFIIDMVSKMYLENVRLAQEQLESLCASLARAGSLRTVGIRHLTCKTHNDNLQDCNVMFDLSRHQGLEDLTLLDHGVGEVRGVSLCQNTDKLRWLQLGGFCISAFALRQILEALPEHFVQVWLGYSAASPLRVRRAEEARNLMEEIRHSTRVILQNVEYTGDECVVNLFGFYKE